MKAHERPQVSFLPEGIVAWDQLFSTPLNAYPWPYTTSQIQEILSLLPEQSRGDSSAGETIVLAARRFYWRQIRDRERQGSPKAITQIANAAEACAAFQQALKAMGAEAHTRVIAKYSRSEDPFKVYLEAMDASIRYEYVLRDAVKDLENDQGRPTNFKLGQFLLAIYLLYRNSLGNPQRLKGFPRFRDACLSFTGAETSKDTTTLERALKRALGSRKAPKIAGLTRET